MKQLTCLVFLASFGAIWASNSLIIDTDGDGNDAVATIIALNNVKNYTIEGITTLKGIVDVDQATINVLKVLDVSGFLGKVKVYKGSANALVRDRPNYNFFGTDGMGDFDYPKQIDASKYVEETNAAVFLAETVKTKPGVVTILCLGPLTNIALASRLNPDFFTQVKQILICGGSITGEGTCGPDENAEYNTYMDPEAAMAVYSQVPDEKPVIILPFESLQNTPVPMSFRVDTLGKLGSNIMNFLNQAEYKSLTGNYWLCYDATLAVIINDWDVAPKFVIGTPVVETSGRMVVGPGNNAVFITDLTSSRLQTCFVTYLESAASQTS